MTKSIHFRGLNGIRALAAIGVMLAHIIGDLPLFGLSNTFIGTTSSGGPKPILMASYGVTIFFTLSGFLITYLILKEKQVSNTINVKNFYMRRVLRIWPLYYLYLAICLVVYYLLNIEYDSSLIGFYIFLAANIPLILGGTLPYAGHLWSIAVEEQFYLFWPWVCKVKKNLLAWLIVLLVFYTVLKFVFYYLSVSQGISWPIIAITTNRFGSMIAGGIAGVLFFRDHSIIKIITSIWVQLLCYLILILSVINVFHISSALIDHEIMTVVAIGIILSQITRTNYIVNLDAKLPNFLGKLSYGIYVYHPMVILLSSYVLSSITFENTLGYVSVFAFIFGITILVSYISYRYFEVLFIKKKKSFSTVHSKA